MGQDSSRKRREEKIKKLQDELAQVKTLLMDSVIISEVFSYLSGYKIQERTANAAIVASNVVRWVMGPSGTIVTFPNEIGFPSILEPKNCRYSIHISPRNN